jgi:ribosome-binding protein aMBF1 (putative translation factor)
MAERCEFCGRPIKGDPEIVVRRGKIRIYCSDFCFKLHFYDAPTITYEDLQNMYKLRCVSVRFD